MAGEELPLEVPSEDDLWQTMQNEFAQHAERAGSFVDPAGQSAILLAGTAELWGESCRVTLENCVFEDMVLFACHWWPLDPANKAVNHDNVSLKNGKLVSSDNAISEEHTLLLLEYVLAQSDFNISSPDALEVATLKLGYEPLTDIDWLY